MDYVTFGKTELQVSRLAFGTGTNGWMGRSQQSDLGIEQLANLLQLAYDRGVNIWDTADAYGTHPHIARTLQSIPRDKVVIVTKTLARNGKRVKNDIERFLRELNSDTLDIVLLHFITQPDWTQHLTGAMEALSRAKEEGKLRAVGVSCHSLGALSAAAESDWVEVAMVRINPDSMNMDASPAKVVPIIEKMYASGKAIYGMKVLGCGQLAKKARTTIQYVFQLGTIHAITIGISTKEQLFENINLVEELTLRPEK